MAGVLVVAEAVTPQSVDEEYRPLPPPVVQEIALAIIVD
jgi:hypothetical protein